MIEWSIREIVDVIGGEIVAPNGTAVDDIRISGISTDSRSIEACHLFVALIGERFDGHQFCNDVAQKGVRAFLVSRISALPENSVGIVVRDTLKAYQDLARYQRIRLGCKVIAVTGSVGKTSTRRMIAAAFGSFEKTFATDRNNNNEIGLPSTILSAPNDTRIMVLEMGMRQRGEIRLLSDIARPDIAVVTNIGFSHIERLGSREEILAAKTEICEGLGPGGILIIDGDDSLLTEFVRKPENKRWEYLGISSFEKDRCGESTRYIYPENVVTNGLETSFIAVLSREDQTFCRVDIKLATTGRHHVKNALFSLLCADFFGVDLANVATALGQCRPMEGRGKIINTRHYTVFDDAYNAGPESMLAAFESIDIFAGDRRKIAAIGGMLELGNYAPELHRQVGISAAESGIDDLYACGEFAENMREGALSLRPEMRVHIFENKETLLNDLLRALEPGDVILTKASHAFGFDWVAEEIIKYDGGPVMSDSYGDPSSSEREVGLC